MARQPRRVSLNPKLPSRLEKVIHKAMEKDRDLRYQRASEIRTDLNRIRLGIESRQQAAGLRRELLAAMVVVLIAAIAGGSLLALAQQPADG